MKRSCPEVLFERRAIRHQDPPGCLLQTPDLARFMCRYLALAPLALVVLASCASASTVDLPVATGGFEQWAGVVGKAMSFGGKNQDQSLQALKTFQSKVFANVQKQVGISRLFETSSPCCVDISTLYRLGKENPQRECCNLFQHVSAHTCGGLLSLGGMDC